MNAKVLLIEDLPVIQDLYGDFLRNHGYSVDTASDGKRALNLTKENEYNFVLVDLLLPNTNGIEFLEQFSDRPQQTKVIVLSDFDEPKTRAKAEALGIAEYLIKAEHTPHELLEKLNGYIDETE